MLRKFSAYLWHSLAVGLGKPMSPTLDQHTTAIVNSLPHLKLGLDMLDSSLPVYKYAETLLEV